MSIKLSFILLLLLASFTLQSKNKSSKNRSHNAETVPATSEREEIIRFAKNLLGTPYHYASSNPKKGFDCSGFVNYVFKNFKINVPRSSGDFAVLSDGLKPEEFKVGDVLVFYGFRNHKRVGHVGIICEADGMNSRFIHSSSGRSGGVIISHLGSNMYTRRFYKCVDVID